MIKYNYEVSVNENRAKLNKDIFLFRGNRNIHYYFSIKGARFTFSKENEDLLESSNAIYAAVTVVKPNGVEVANAIAPVEDGLIHLKVTEDLIDEEVEVGDFDLVFDLFDDNEGAVTIPKIKGQFHVQERPCTTSIGILSGNVNVVNQAVVDLAIATQENEQLIVVDDDGKYVKTTWAKGDKISVERLNKMEEGIYNNSSRLKNIGTGGSTNASDITITDVNDNFESANVEGALNELGTQYKDIANKLKLVAGDNNTIKLMFGDKELSSITINGGTIEKPVYGNIIFDKNFVKIGENGTGKIGIKLDKKPTQTQTISISEDSDILSVDKTSLTFTSNNYDTYQYITITVGNIDTSETVNIKFINSDELLTESNASIYVVADGDEYNVDTTFPTGAYTVTSADFTDNTVNGDYVILGAYSGTKSNIIVPATMEVDGATKKVMLKSATFSTNTTIQYIQIDSATVINMHGTINQIATSSLRNAFAKCTSLIGFKYDCNRVDNISNTWSGCSKLKFVVGLDNYVKCSDMSQAFMNCSELEYIQDLSKLTLCTNLTQTFNGCTKLKKIYGLPSGATNMNMALYKCAVLENIVIPKNVTDLFYCFSGNTSLKKIEILSEGVTRADQMLQNCGTVSVYMVKDSTTYTTISKIYSSSANVTLAYIGADSIPVISTWGDSTTSRGTDGLAWPSRLQNEITTHNVKNMAISGEFTTSTSCRQGGNQAHVKTAFTIPATCTEVEVELESKDKQTFSNSPVLSTECNYNPVTISNIEGYISCKNNKYYFTRYKEGNEVQVNANTEVISKTSEARKNDDIMIIYLGTNSGWNDTPAELLAQVQSMVNYYQGTKYIIATEATGYRLRTESTRAITTQVETLFSTTFGEHYFNLRQYLIDNSLTENSLTATDVDNSRIALGQVPASILMGASDLNAGKAGGDGVDDTHYNTYGLESVKNAFKSKLISLGYITIN